MAVGMSQGPELDRVREQLYRYVPKVSVHNEFRAWEVLETLIEKILEYYPTTIEQDEAIIEENELENQLGRDKLNAVIYRKAEKQVLQVYRHYASLVKKLIVMEPEDAKNEFLAMKNWRYFNHFKEYFEKEMYQLMLLQNKWI